MESLKDYIISEAGKKTHEGPRTWLGWENAGGKPMEKEEPKPEFTKKLDFSIKLTEAEMYYVLNAIVDAWVNDLKKSAYASIYKVFRDEASKTFKLDPDYDEDIKVANRKI